MSEVTYDYSELYRQYRPQGGVLTTTAFLAVVACVINCALPQIEMLLTAGSVPVPVAVIKIACFCLLTLLALTYGRLDLSAFPTGMWLAAMTFLFLDFSYLWLWEGKTPADIILGYNAYYCPLIFAPLACAFTGRLSEKSATRILVSIFLVCAMIGWAQFISQKPVIQMASSDGNFRIYISWWTALGQRSIRAFGVFGTALEYGSFAVLIAAIGIGMCGRPKGWIKGVPLYLLAAACCYTTLTRVVYVQLAFTTFAAIAFTFGRRLRRMIWQPLIGLVLGSFVAFSGIAKLVGQTGTVYDASSLDLRLLQWEIFGAQFLHSTFLQKMLGLGFSQAEKPAIVPLRDEMFGSFTNVLVDNMYLALALHIGLVGMVIIVGLLWALWRRLRIETVKRPTPLLIGIASFWSTFLLTGMFNLELAQYGFWFLIAIMLLQRDGEADVGSLGLRQPHTLFGLASERARSVS
ncbi:MAG TPA: hypothetical protein VEH30_12760 [Terriglobales bacterium]|nr:hypothetical protein [Terriglobales bacterium]